MEIAKNRRGLWKYHNVSWESISYLCSYSAQCFYLFSYAVYFYRMSQWHSNNWKLFFIVLSIMCLFWLMPESFLYIPRRQKLALHRFYPFCSIDVSTEEAQDDKSVSILHAKLLHLACAASLTVWAALPMQGVTWPCSACRNTTSRSSVRWFILFLLGRDSGEELLKKMSLLKFY